MDMDKNSYLNLDIRALNTFLIIIETSSITATANQLNITQSAVSHGLEKLRGIFQDELFLRAGRGIKPTPRAKQLHEELRPLLANIRALTKAADFEPAKAQINWTIAANDFQRDMLLPGFYQRVASQVKHFVLNVIPSEIPAADLLRDDAVNLAISPMPPDAPDILQKRLFTTHNHCFYDASCRSAPNTIEDFKQANYISLTFTAGKFITEENPLALAIENKVRVRVSNFAGLPGFLRGSELLTIAPLLMKNHLLAGFAETPLPYTQPKFNMYMLWHQRYQNDAAHQWLRTQFFHEQNS